VRHRQPALEAPADSKEEPEKEGIRHQRVVDKVSPNELARNRVGEEEEEAGGEAGRAPRLSRGTLTACQAAAEPPVPDLGGCLLPGVQPSTGPVVLDRLGAGGKGSLGVLSCPKAAHAMVFCAMGLSLTWAEKSGWHLFSKLTLRT